MKTPIDLPHVGVVTDAEIAQAICNQEARDLGVDPVTNKIDFKVTYRNVKDNIGGGQRLFASIVITGISPKPPPAPEKEPSK